MPAEPTAVPDVPADDSERYAETTFSREDDIPKLRLFSPLSDNPKRPEIIVSVEEEFVRVLW